MTVKIPIYERFMSIFSVGHHLVDVLDMTNQLPVTGEKFAMKCTQKTTFL